MSFAPKPPPTSGATIRTRFLSTSSSSARSLRTSNGTCVETQIVYPPSSSGTTAIALVSMGTGATRCCTTRARATTSAPASASASQSCSNACATFDPWAGNSMGAPSAAAASTSVTASSASTTGHTSSAASCPCASESAITTATGSPT